MFVFKITHLPFAPWLDPHSSAFNVDTSFCVAVIKHNGISPPKEVKITFVFHLARFVVFTCSPSATRSPRKLL